MGATPSPITVTPTAKWDEPAAQPTLGDYDPDNDHGDTLTAALPDTARYPNPDTSLNRVIGGPGSYRGGATPEDFVSIKVHPTQAEVIHGRGLLHVYTGEGKGKTTAALGVAVRMREYHKKVHWVSFLKQDKISAETRYLKPFSKVSSYESNKIAPLYDRSWWDPIIMTRLLEEAVATADEYDLLVLDELNVAVSLGYIPFGVVIDFLDKRPLDLEIIITGRNAPTEFIERADYVTYMQEVKHPFRDRGLLARKGIEY